MRPEVSTGCGRGNSPVLFSAAREHSCSGEPALVFGNDLSILEGVEKHPGGEAFFQQPMGGGI